MNERSDSTIVFRNVSKFYGEVLGINRINLDIPPGLTGLVGPNGSGKSTMMHLMTGLLKPSKGHISVLGIPPDKPEELFRMVGYCCQYDSFPPGSTGLSFLQNTLALHGLDRTAADEAAWKAIERVGLEEAARRKVAGYSKGMRQRIKLAQAICHDAQVLILDEPLNGLDPMARAEVIDFMRNLASEGRHVIVSSHILHEVDVISDQVILVHGGSVVAEGEIRAVRGEITRHPIQILIRCNQPQVIAARAFELDHVVEARILEEEGGLLIRTRDADAFFKALNEVVLENQIDIETVAPADENVDAVYGYLIGNPGGEG
ncbi:MAG: ABC transporter ATP-binding protein [bacterium]|nr:ABC transporter ATP-binding protein [bacterium]